MATLTIRNLDTKTVNKLKQRAKRNQRSLEAEVRHIIARSVEQPDRRELWKLADQIAAMTPKDIQQTDSTDLLREDRDNDLGR